MTPTPSPTPTPEPEYIDISGSKTWNDNDDELGLRPESVTVRLLRNGEVIDQTTMSAATGWTYSFENLPETDEFGNRYNYTVSEQIVNGYYGRVSGFDLINDLVPTTTTTTTTDEGEDITIREYNTPLGFLSTMDLESMIDLFDYGTPLFGVLGTGDEIPVYPFIFAGVGLVAVIALVAQSRKKRKNQRV